MRMLLLVMAVAVTAAQPPTVERAPIGERDSLSVEFALPEGWHRVRHPRPDDPWSHREVVFALNNRNDDSLCVIQVIKDLPGGGRSFTFGPEAFEQQLEPGTVYLDLTYSVGGPLRTSVPYAWTIEEQPAIAIQQGIRDPDKAWTTRKVVIYRASFVHWGERWEATVAARKPYKKQDLEHALSVLESIHFPDVPVGDPRQAVEVAIPALPAEFRDQFKEDPSCACCRLYDVVTVPLEAGYHVTFNLMDTQTRRLLGTKSVYVTLDGRANVN